MLFLFHVILLNKGTGYVGAHMLYLHLWLETNYWDSASCAEVEQTGLSCCILAVVYLRVKGEGVTVGVFMMLCCCCSS